MTQYFFVPEYKGLSLEQVDELSKSDVKVSTAPLPAHPVTQED